eukprot:809315_1
MTQSQQLCACDGLTKRQRNFALLTSGTLFIVFVLALSAGAKGAWATAVATNVDTGATMDVTLGLYRHGHTASSDGSVTRDMWIRIECNGGDTCEDYNEIANSVLLLNDLIVLYAFAAANCLLFTVIHNRILAGWYRGIAYVLVAGSVLYSVLAFPIYASEGANRGEEYLKVFYTNFNSGTYLISGFALSSSFCLSVVYCFFAITSSATLLMPEHFLYFF